MWSMPKESKWYVASMGGGQRNNAIKRSPEDYTCENDFYLFAQQSFIGSL